MSKEKTSFKTKMTEEHNSLEEYNWLWFLFSAYHRIMLNICIKFHVNTFDSCNVIYKSEYNCQLKVTNGHNSMRYGSCC